MPFRAFASRTLALGFGAGFVYCVSHYPMEKTWLAPVLLLYVALMCWRPQLWLFALPALLPVLDLAPWTGWFFLEEIDLLLMITAGFAYWRLAPAAPTAPGARLPVVAILGIAGIALAYAVGLCRGLMPLPALDANAFASSLSGFNSVRVGKSWFWALTLLPALMRDAGPRLDMLERYFIPGMLFGLALVSGADIWERLVFPGLMDFSSDYRTTAPFSGMNTGGAALDGYLALAFPFVAMWLLPSQTRRRNGAAIALLALGAYAGLSTFSRGLYAAYAVAAMIIAGFLLATAFKKAGVGWRFCLGGVAGAALLVYVLVEVFSSSGYRGFAAALILLVAAAVLATRAIQWKLLPATLLCAIALTVTLGSVLSFGADTPGMLKPPYLLFMLSGLTFAGAAGMDRRAGSPLMMAFCCLALSTVWIAWHWGGSGALLPSALVAGIAVAVLNAGARTPRWQADRASLTMTAAGAIVLAMVIPICASYHASERFASTRSDLQERIRHWTQSIHMMDRDVSTQILGMGLGKFPITYFERNPLGEQPGTLRYVDEASNRYLQLGTAQYAQGYGEMLRVLQRLAVRPDTRYLLALDIRRISDRSALQVSICERLLLYPRNCVAAPLHLLPPNGRWQHYVVALDSGVLGAGAWPLRAPTQLEISVGGEPSWLDVDNVSLREEISGSELIHNGSFSDGYNYWFFSSDRHHLPWHIKNIALNVYFELGWLGISGFLILLAFAFVRLAAQAGAGNARGAAYLAALAGFLTVGIFDSLLDVPRLGLLFFLVLFVALMQPARIPQPLAERSRP